MPLVKDLNVDPDLCGDTYRRREFVLQKDFIRRQELGAEVSIRASSMKGSVLIQTLRAISEESVVINESVLQVYADAEDWLCRRMNHLFQTVRGLGIRPIKMTKEIHIFNEGFSESSAKRGCDLVWIPACAFYVGDERVYLFRVVSKGYAASGSLIDMRKSGAIGYTKEYLNVLSPELAAYINKLEGKAMQDEEVKNAFTLLGSILKPEQYKEELLEERAKAYSKVADFGGWA